MDLVMEIPQENFTSLRPFIDKPLVKMGQILDEPYWVYCPTLQNTTQGDIDSLLKAERIILPYSLSDSIYTYYNLQRIEELLGEYASKSIPVWVGFKRDLDKLISKSALVALPWSKLRGSFIPKGDGDCFAYLGFSNLSELREEPPMYLITGTPIKAALLGIDISLRERRPKQFHNLPIRTLQPYELDLAIETIRKIRESCNGR